MILKNIQAALEADEFTTSFAPAEEQVPIDRLLILLPNDLPHEMVLEQLVIPGLDEELENSFFLQHFLVLPCHYTTFTLHELRQFLLYVNINMPLPTFGINEEDHFVYCKYVSVLAPGTPDNWVKQVVETVWLIDYFVELFFHMIEAVASGKLSAAQAIAQMQTAQSSEA